MTRLFVANFPYQTTEEDLRNKFCLYGELKDVFLIGNKDGTPRGICFIEFLKAEDAENAMRELDGALFEGRRLAVKPANERISKTCLTSYHQG